MRMIFFELELCYFLTFLHSSTSKLVFEKAIAKNRGNCGQAAQMPENEESPFGTQILFIDLDIEPEYEVWISKELCLYGMSFLDRIYYKNSLKNENASNKFKKLNDRIEKTDTLKNTPEQKSLSKQNKKEKDINFESEGGADYKDYGGMTDDINNNRNEYSEIEYPDEHYQIILVSKEHDVTNMVLDNKKYDFILYNIERGRFLVIRNENSVYIFNWYFFKIYLESMARNYHISYQHYVHFNDKMNEKVSFVRSYQNYRPNRTRNCDTIKSTRRYRILNSDKRFLKKLSDENHRNKTNPGYVCVDRLPYEYLKKKNPEIKNFRISEPEIRPENEYMHLKAKQKEEDDKMADMLRLKIQKEREEAFKIYEPEKYKKTAEKVNDQKTSMGFWDWFTNAIFF